MDIIYGKTYLNNPPMQITRQISLHSGVVGGIVPMSGGMFVQILRQRYSACNQYASVLLRLARERHEHSMRPHKVWIGQPIFQIGVEITQKDEDCEGAVEGVLRDANVGDPFVVQPWLLWTISLR